MTWLWLWKDFVCLYYLRISSIFNWRFSKKFYPHNLTQRKRHIVVWRGEGLWWQSHFRPHTTCLEHQAAHWRPTFLKVRPTQPLICSLEGEAKLTSPNNDCKCGLPLQNIYLKLSVRCFNLNFHLIPFQPSLAAY